MQHLLVYYSATIKADQADVSRKKGIVKKIKLALDYYYGICFSW